VTDGSDVDMWLVTLKLLFSHDPHASTMLRITN
jgi:hypothetical protein